MILSVKREPAVDVPTQVGAWISNVPEMDKERFEKITPAPSSIVPLPPNWTGAEMIGTFVDAMEFTQSYRIIACGVEIKGELVLVVIRTPESIARAAPGYLTSMLSRIRLY